NQQERMIKSLLNKPFRKVTIDKYISRNGLNNKIVLNPKEVKSKVNRKKSVNSATMQSNWKLVYEPKKEIREDWYKEISGQPNQFASSILLSEITNDKRKKKWILSEKVSEVTKIETRIKKCSGCKHNRSTVEENCIMHIKFDEGWKVILKNAINPPKNEQGFKELHCLESPKKELILQAELSEKLKEEILAILTRNLNH
ncbi:9544_t:CDS:2, partial [Gigaspora margarita]